MLHRTTAPRPSRSDAPPHDMSEASLDSQVPHSYSIRPGNSSLAPSSVGTASAAANRRCLHPPFVYLFSQKFTMTPETAAPLLRVSGQPEMAATAAVGTIPHDDHARHAAAHGHAHRAGDVRVYLGRVSAEGFQRCNRQAFRGQYSVTYSPGHPLWILRQDYLNLKCRYRCWNTNPLEGHSALVQSVAHFRDERQITCGSWRYDSNQGP